MAQEVPGLRARAEAPQVPLTTLLLLVSTVLVRLGRPLMEVQEVQESKPLSAVVPYMAALVEAEVGG